MGKEILFIENHFSVKLYLIYKGDAIVPTCITYS